MKSATVLAFMLLCAVGSSWAKKGVAEKSTRTVREGVATEGNDAEVDVIARGDRQVYGAPTVQISELSGGISGGYGDAVSGGVSNGVGTEYGAPVTQGLGGVAGGYGVPRVNTVAVPVVSVVRTQGIGSPLLGSQAYGAPVGGYGAYNSLGYSSQYLGGGGFGSQYNGGYRNYGRYSSPLSYSYGAPYQGYNNYFRNPNVGYGSIGVPAYAYQQQSHFRPYHTGYNYQQYYRYRPFTAYNGGYAGGVSGGYN